MNEILSIGLQSMQSDSARVEQIAMNLANALTPGYRRTIAVQAPVGTSFAEHLTGITRTTKTDRALPRELLAFREDQRAGTVRSTGQPLDVALGGNAYLEVATDQGPAYTRHGSLRVDARGRLVAAQGHPVMGHAGEILLTTSAPVITSTGAILAAGSTEDTPLAQLKLVEFSAKEPLRPLGDGLFEAGDEMKVLQPQDTEVRQGYLENSNVTSTQEMTNLIQTLRHFESMLKVAQSYDEMLGNAIRKLGDGS